MVPLTSIVLLIDRKNNETGKFEEFSGNVLEENAVKKGTYHLTPIYFYIVNVKAQHFIPPLHITEKHGKVYN